MMIHELKSQPQFFAEILAGRKTHDLRRNDRGFYIGDRIRLREWKPDEERYTGREVEVEITYITDHESPCTFSPAALHPDFCILSVRAVDRDPPPVPLISDPSLIMPRIGAGTRVPPRPVQPYIGVATKRLIRRLRGDKRAEDVREGDWIAVDVGQINLSTLALKRVDSITHTVDGGIYFGLRNDQGYSGNSLVVNRDDKVIDGIIYHLRRVICRSCGMVLPAHCEHHTPPCCPSTCPYPLRPDSEDRVYRSWDPLVEHGGDGGGDV